MQICTTTRHRMGQRGRNELSRCHACNDLKINMREKQFFATTVIFIYRIIRSSLKSIQIFQTLQ